MHLTTRMRYATRALGELARRPHGATMQVQDIAEAQQISARYLEQIFRRLKEAGLVGSRRGPRGGYFLRRKPEEIDLYEVLLATEGPVSLVPCLDQRAGDGEATCGSWTDCAARHMWGQARDQIADVFRGTTVRDVCQRADGAPSQAPEP